MSIKKRTRLFRELTETSDNAFKSFDDGLINEPEFVNILEEMTRIYREGIIESLERDIEDYRFTVDKMTVR